MRTLIACLLAALVVAGCGEGPAGPGGERAPPERAADIVGTMTSVTAFEPVTEDCVDPDADAAPDDPVSSDDEPRCTPPAVDLRGTVLIEAEPGTGGGDATAVRVDGSTLLLRATEGGFEEIGFDELVEGGSAEAWYDGPVAESYPAQATGEALVVRA